MGRKTWVMPMTLVQEFEANETVAAQCWYVKCDRAYEYGGPFNLKGWYTPPGEIAQEHAENICGTAVNQILQDTTGDGKPDRMIEVGNGDKVCTIYSDSDYKNELPASEVVAGEIIYWTNVRYVLGIPQTYYHKGTPVLADPAHRNAS